MSPDAATLPSPPDFAPWGSASRPRSLGGMHPGRDQISRPGSYQNGSHARAVSRPPRYPNIKDLQDQALSLNANEDTPVRWNFDALLRGSKTANLVYRLIPCWERPRKRLSNARTSPIETSRIKPTSNIFVPPRLQSTLFPTIPSIEGWSMSASAGTGSLQT